MTTDNKYPHKELSYKIIGLLYKVYNEIGFGYQEKYYARALALLLKEYNIMFKQELHTPIIFKGKIIGRYYVDFLIEDKIVVELKISNEVYDRHFKQVIGYLESNRIKLGIIALITPNGIKIKRIVK